MKSDKMQFIVVEISINKFDTAIAQQIMLLKNHITNIEKFSALSEYEKAQMEEINANRIVKKMDNLIQEIDNLKSHVDNSNIPKFNDLTRKSKHDVFTIVQQFSALNRKTNRQKKTENQQYEDEEDQTEKEVPLLQIQSNVQDMQLEIEETRLKKCELLEQHCQEIQELFEQVNSMVVVDGELVKAAEENVEHTADNVQEGQRNLLRALNYKKTMYPLCGALLGVCVGGPVGLLAGIKVGVGVALGGGIAGFTGAKILKNSAENPPDNVHEEVDGANIRNDDINGNNEVVATI